jgi:hypothetical protein
VTLRITPSQRDELLRSERMPQSLGHALHRAAVKRGWLNVRVGRKEVEAMILAAAALRAADKKEERVLTSLLDYLESLEERFVDPENEKGGAGAPPDDGD